MNKKTYEKLKQYAYLLGLPTVFYNTYDIITNPSISNIGYRLLNELYIFSLLMLFNKKKSNDNLDEIIKLYQDFLNNYTSLEDKYEINDPLEIFIFYNLLRDNGFLSYGKKFKSGKNNIVDIDMDLNGVNVLNGTGVCRHISPLFVHLLRNKNYKADLIYTNSMILDDVILNERLSNLIKQSDYFESTSPLELLNKLKDEFTYEELKEIKLLFKNQSEHEKMFGNHIIVATSYHNDLLFLDATNDKIYNKNEKEYIKKSVYEHESCNSKCILTSNSENILSIKDYPDSFDSAIDNASEVRINYDKKIKYLHNLFESEINEFDKFYTKNETIYNDVHNKLLKYKQIH